MAGLGASKSRSGRHSVIHLLYAGSTDADGAGGADSVFDAARLSLSDALNLAEKSGILQDSIRRALAFGRVSAEDAAIYCAMAEESIANLLPLEEYIRDPAKLPTDDTARWFVFCRIRNLVQRGEMKRYSKDEVHRFLMAVPTEHRFALMVELPKEWGELGAAAAFRTTLKEVTGI